MISHLLGPATTPSLPEGTPITLSEEFPVSGSQAGTSRGVESDAEKVDSFVFDFTWMGCNGLKGKDLGE